MGLKVELSLSVEEKILSPQHFPTSYELNTRFPSIFKTKLIINNAMKNIVYIFICISWYANTLFTIPSFLISCKTYSIILQKLLI